MTGEQYTQLAQFWDEFMALGPTLEQSKLDLTGLAHAFMNWIDSDDDEYTGLYSVEEILKFFAEKERREGEKRNFNGQAY